MIDTMVQSVGALFAFFLQDLFSRDVHTTFEAICGSPASSVRAEEHKL